MDCEILIVEDQRSLAQMAAKMLHERWGCRVLIATTLAQVRTIVAQKQHHFFVGSPPKIKSFSTLIFMLTLRFWQ